MQKILLAAMSVVLIAASGAQAAPANKCFFVSEFQNWKAPDNKTIYIRVGVNEFYRLDLSASCPSLT